MVIFMRQPKKIVYSVIATIPLIITSCITTAGDPMPSEGKFIEQYYSKRTINASEIREKREKEISLILASDGGQAEVPDLERYANDVLQRIVSASPHPEYPAQVYLTSSNSPHARAFPNGVILASIGLLQAAKNEDELAFTLAHEFSHVLLDHHDSDWFLQAQQHAIAAAELSAGTMEQLRKRIGEGPELDWRLAAITYGAQIFTRDMLFPVFNRYQEDEADLLGVDLMVRAGYNMLAAKDALELYEAHETQGTDQKVARNRLERALELSDLERLQTARAKEITEDEALARPIGVLFEAAHHGIDELLALGRQTHRPAGERIDRIMEYGQRTSVEHFPEMSSQALRAALQVPATRRTLANYRAANDAIMALDDDRISEAERLARQAVTAPTSMHAYTRLALAKVREAQGRPDLWEENLRIALKGSAPPISIYRDLATRLAATGRTEEASLLLDEGWERYDEPGYLLPSRIRVAIAANDRQRATELLMLCRLQHPELTEECETAGADVTEI